MRRKRKDEESWEMGMYNLSAFSVALARALNGKKTKAEYLDAPLSEKAGPPKAEEDMTEEEKKAERKKLLATLQIMQTNYELNHSGEGK